MRTLIGLWLTVGAMAWFSTTARGDLVVNGNFATGNLTGWTFVPAAGGSDFGIVTTGNPPEKDYVYFAGFDVGYYDEIYQNLTTVPGTEYLMTFELDQSAYPASTNSFVADWAGSPVLDLTNQPALAFTEYSFDVTATSTNTQISFAGYNKTSAFGLTDISVTPLAIPEPSSLVLLAIGLTASGCLLARKRGRVPFSWRDNRSNEAESSARQEKGT